MSGIFELINRSLALYRAHAAFFAGYAAWLLLPYAGTILSGLIPNEAVTKTLTLVFLVIFIVLSLWLMTLIMLGTRAFLAGEKPDSATVASQAWSLFRPVVWVTFLMTVIVAGGSFLLVIPGIIFSVWYTFAGAEVALDGSRGLQALTRSRELVRGRFFRILWRVWGGPIAISLVYYFLLSIVILLIAAATQIPFDILLGDNPPLWADVLSTVADVFMAPVTGIYLTLVYLEAIKTAPRDSSLPTTPQNDTK